MAYHINPNTGEIGRCSAKKQCPFGDLTADHFDTPDEARSAYENQMSNSTFTAPAKKAQLEDRMVARLKDSMGYRLARLRNAVVSVDVADTLYHEAPKIAVAGGLVSAVLIGGGLMQHHATQDYNVVTSEVVSSVVDSHTTVTKVGNTTTVNTYTDTHVVAKVPEREGTIEVTLDEGIALQQGQDLTVYQTGADDFTSIQPNSGKQYAYDGAFGLMGGMMGGVGILLASDPLADRIRSRQRRRRGLSY